MSSDQHAVQLNTIASSNTALSSEDVFAASRTRPILLICCSLVSILLIADLPLHLLHGRITCLFDVLAVMLLVMCSPVHSLFQRRVIDWPSLKLTWQHWPCPKGAVLILATMIGATFLRLITDNIAHGEMACTLLTAFFVALVFPLSGIASVILGNSFFKSSRRAAELDASVAEKLFPKALADSARILFTQVYPYRSFYFGVTTFCILSSVLPGGIGQAFADWLYCSARDANLIESIAGIDPTFQLFVSGLSAFMLITCLDATAVRWSAGYQLFLRNLCAVNRGASAFSALTQAVKEPIKTIVLRSRHPHIRSAFESLFYIVACYAILFWIIAFCPGSNFFSDIVVSPNAQAPHSVASGITGWLSASVIDAGFDGSRNLPLVDLGVHQNLRIFLASIFAAYGTAPFAIMSCVFLPPRKAQCLYLNAEGVLFPQMAWGRKMQFWSELQSVHVEKVGTKNETLKLCFVSKTLTLKTKNMEREKLKELLAAADEYSPRCFFDDAAIKLKCQLNDSNRNSSLAVGKNFESTIFSPYKPGTELKQGAYRIVRKLASKPLNAVYLVRMTDGVRCILKQYVSPQNAEIGERQRVLFQRECEMLAQVDQPLIARIVDTFEEPGASFIAIEHIPGSDLRELVALTGPRSESVVTSWALDICEQLKYLHSRVPAILHRDLTPDNLLLDESGRIRIIDFGAALHFMEGVTGTLIGKQAYIAPEQLRGKPSTRSDIYSFGATLYFLLTGQDPRALQQCDVSQSEASISHELADLIKRCTEFEADSRPESIVEVENWFRQHASTGRKQDSKTIPAVVAIGAGGSVRSEEEIVEGESECPEFEWVKSDFVLVTPEQKELV